MWWKCFCFPKKFAAISTSKPEPSIPICHSHAQCILNACLPHNDYYFNTLLHETFFHAYSTAQRLSAQTANLPFWRGILIINGVWVRPNGADQSWITGNQMKLNNLLKIVSWCSLLISPQVGISLTLRVWPLVMPKWSTWCTNVMPTAQVTF